MLTPIPVVDPESGKTIRGLIDPPTARRNSTMSTQLPTALALALLAIGQANAAEGDKAATAAAPSAVFINASELKWGDAPPGLPKGAHLAVLFGDPGKEGPFAVRFKMPDGYQI